MFTAVKINLEMAHVVANSKNPKERNIHGHTWKFEVTFEGENLDYDVLYGYIVNEIYFKFDHCLLIELGKYNEKLKKHLLINFQNIISFTEPTAENILINFQSILQFPPMGKIAKLKLWEGTKYYVKIK